MLYECWRQIASDHRPETALVELTSGREWTFDQLARQSESLAPESARNVIYPQGNTAEFVFAVLRGWRAGQVVVPLEPGQKPLEVRGLGPGIAHLKTTSATTGSARAVAFTSEQLRADAANIVQTMGLRPDWPNLGVISLGHSYGFSNLILPLLLHGIPLLLLDSPLPEAIRRSAEPFRDLTLAAVPALWRAWDEAGAIPHNVRLAISAGAALPVALEGAIFRKSGLKLHNFYGATECGGIAYDATTMPRKDSALAGTALNNVNLSIAEDGCLSVQSAAVGQTYWPEPAANLLHGWYHTSDIAELKGQQIFLRGRANDQINVAARKVAPEVIEQSLLGHPTVAECLVFGVPGSDHLRSEVIVAAVVTRAPVAPEVLKDYLLTRLPAWQVPRQWWFVEALGANQRGKLSRATWRNKYLEFTAARQKPGKGN